MISGFEEQKSLQLYRCIFMLPLQNFWKNIYIYISKIIYILFLNVGTSISNGKHNLTAKMCFDILVGRYVPVINSMYVDLKVNIGTKLFWCFPMSS